MNNRKLSPVEFARIKALAEEVAYAPTKAAGKNTRQELDFYIMNLKSQVRGDINNVLDQVAGYAASASGQVRDKANFMGGFEAQLYTLEALVDQEKQ